MYNREVRFDYGVPKKCVFGRHWSKPFEGKFTEIPNLWETKKKKKKKIEKTHAKEK